MVRGQTRVMGAEHGTRLLRSLSAGPALTTYFDDNENDSVDKKHTPKRLFDGIIFNIDEKMTVETNF